MSDPAAFRAGLNCFRVRRAPSAARGTSSSGPRGISVNVPVGYHWVKGVSHTPRKTPQGSTDETIEGVLWKVPGVFHTLSYMNELVAVLATVQRRRDLPTPAMCRALRVENGLTQATIADACKVTRVTVTRWENGTRSPCGSVRDRYLDVLDTLRRQR